MKIYVDQVPEELTVMGHIKATTNWKEACESVEPKIKTHQYEFSIKSFEQEAIFDSIRQSLAIYGEHGWKSAEGESKDYVGFSLVYNPNHQEYLNLHSSTLGTSKNQKNHFFWGKTETHTKLKNSYFDTLGFNKQTPASQFDALGKFLSRRKCQMIRGRLSSIDGTQIENTTVGWHRDEPVFENLRLNVPIVTTKDYLFQTEGKEPCHLEVGKAYSWDTNTPHRVFNTKWSETKRTHLVIGFSPWLNYNEKERYWESNEFYGKKHPFDMLIDGDVFAGLDYNQMFHS